MESHTHLLYFIMCFSLLWLQCNLRGIGTHRPRYDEKNYISTVVSVKQERWKFQDFQGVSARYSFSSNICKR